MGTRLPHGVSLRGPETIHGLCGIECRIEAGFMLGRLSSPLNETELEGTFYPMLFHGGRIGSTIEHHVPQTVKAFLFLPVLFFIFFFALVFILAVAVTISIAVAVLGG